MFTVYSVRYCLGKLLTSLGNTCDVVLDHSYFMQGASQLIWDIQIV